MRFAGDLGCTCYRLHRAALAAQRLYDRHMAESGLTLGQFSVLATLLELDGVTVTELAEALGLERTTLTRNLRGMMKRDWVCVGEGSDGRTRAVRLRPEGRRAFEAAWPLWEQAQTAVTAAFDPRMLAQLHGLLETTIERLPAP